MRCCVSCGLRAAGWKTTVVALVTRFEELLAPTANGAGEAAGDEAGDAGAGSEAAPEAAAARSQRAAALTSAAHHITHHSMGLQKTRQHFQKARAPRAGAQVAQRCVSCFISRPATR